MKTITELKERKVNLESQRPLTQAERNYKTQIKTLQQILDLIDSLTSMGLVNAKELKARIEGECKEPEQDELKDLSFLKLLNKNVGQCNLNELDRVKSFLIKGLNKYGNQDLCEVEGCNKQFESNGAKYYCTGEPGFTCSECNSARQSETENENAS